MKTNRILLPVMVIAWSIYYILCDILIDVLGSPYFVGLLLRTITFIGLTIFLLLGQKLKFKIKKPKHFAAIITTAILAFVFDCLINIGLQYSSATTGTALLKTEMVFVLFFGWLLYKRKMCVRDAVIALSMAAGSFMIVLGDLHAWSVDWWSLLFVLSAMLNTICAFSIKKIQETCDIGSYQIVYINNTISLLLYFVTVIVFDGSFFLNISQLYQSNLWVVGAVCGVCQMILMLTYYSALSKYQVWIVKATLLLIPIITLFFNVLFSTEKITLVQVVGTGITIVSAFFLVIRDKNNIEVESDKRGKSVD